jgi:2-succinyl-5-enolpyruvyl-6-hydroxy-3-cyclohexene-1-carboxylate synthase
MNIPENTGLFLASSMPVRYMDMFADPSENFVYVESNRGTSGIDGTIASAAGFAESLKKSVTLFIGDIAFIHDLNSLALVRSLQYKLIIVVINNNGGGIFSLLPVARHFQNQKLERYFSTPHDLEFDSAAELFGLHHRRSKDLEQFKSFYAAAFNEERSTIIEVTTKRRELREHLTSMQDQVTCALEE